MISIVINNILTHASLEDVKIINGERVYIVPENIIEIAKNAFISFRDETKSTEFFVDKNEIFKVDKIILSNNITEIKDETFKDVQAQTIVLPNNLQKIGESAFKKSGIEFITLPESLKEIGKMAFCDCINLQEINIPSKVQNLNFATFKFCTQLDTVHFSEGLKTIKTECFYYSGVKNLTIPNSVSVIESFAFASCSFLKQITLPKNKHFVKLSNSLFQECVSLKSIEIPSSVKTISSYCFHACKLLQKIKLPSFIKFYEISCFSKCYNLTEITLINKGKLTAHIGENAFEHCENLQKANLIGAFECYPNIFKTCKKIKYINKDGEIYDFSNFEDVDLFIDNFSALQKLKVISNTIKNKTTLQYDFAYDLCYYNNHKEFENAYFKFYNRLKNKYITNDTDSKNKNKFDVFCYNLGLFEENREISNKAYNFLEEVLSKNLLPVNKLGTYFSSMHAKGYKKDFANFILNKENFKKLMELEYQDFNIITEIYENFDELQQNHRSSNHHHRKLAPTVEYFKSAITKDKFDFVDETNLYIAEEISKFSNKQYHFETALKVTNELNEMIEKTGYIDTPLLEDPFETIDTLEAEILKINQNNLELIKETIDNNFTYEWLRKSDPKNLMLGFYCSCCAHIGGAGDGIMRASIILPNVKNLVIKNEYNRIVAKATLYINQKLGYGVFNTIQVSEDITVNADQNQIFEKFLKGAYAFIKDYNNKNKDNPLKQVNVGLGLNSLRKNIQEKFKEVVPLNAINFSEYKIDNEYDGDWQDMQYCIYNINEEYKKEPGEEDIYLNHD